MFGTKTIAPMVSMLVLLSGCEDGPEGRPYTAAGDEQTPPAGEDALEAWLLAGTYKAWNCEAEVHKSRSPSPHGYNRICSNDVVSVDARGSAPWPKGAAAVKELYDSPRDTKPSGYAVALKTSDDSANGDNWYWYERIGSRVVADGLAAGVCTGCHNAAGTSTARTPTAGARDQIYTPVE